MERNRPLTDAELDLILPSEGYEVSDHSVALLGFILFLAFPFPFYFLMSLIY